MDRLNQVLNEALSPFPDEIQEELRRKFTCHYEQPLTEQVEIVLTKRMTDEETRCLQFFPTREQYKYYVQLIDSAPEKAPKDHPQAKVQRYFLPLFYLHHVQNWELVTEFILHGGLTVLARLIAHPDMQLRGQVIESFIIITSHPSFEWFQHPTTATERQLHFALLNLSNCAVFLPNLLSNRQEGYPGGSYCCLQILAFWLSWVRKFYCKDNELRLSEEILHQLQLWTAKDDMIEEKELAQKVFEDFSRWKIEKKGSQLDGVQDQMEKWISKRNKAMAASDFPTAIEASCRVLELNPKDIDSWRMRSRARLELNEPEAALQDAEHGLAIKETDSEMLECKIQALGLLNRPEQVLGLKDQVQKCDENREKLLRLIEIQRTVHQTTGKQHEILQAILRRGKPRENLSIAKPKPPPTPSASVATQVSTGKRPKGILQRLLRSKNDLAGLSSYFASFSTEELAVKIDSGLNAEVLKILLDLNNIELLKRLEKSQRFKFVYEMSDANIQKRVDAALT